MSRFVILTGPSCIGKGPLLFWRDVEPDCILQKHVFVVFAIRIESIPLELEMDEAFDLHALPVIAIGVDEQLNHGHIEDGALTRLIPR